MSSVLETCYSTVQPGAIVKGTYYLHIIKYQSIATHKLLGFYFSAFVFMFDLWYTVQ